MMNKQNKFLAIFISIAMILTQVMPSGWADANPAIDPNKKPDEQFQKTIEQANQEAQTKKETTLATSAHNTFLSGNSLSLPASSSTKLATSATATSMNKIAVTPFRPIEKPKPILINPVVIDARYYRGYKSIKLESKDPLLKEAQKRFGDKVVTGNGERLAFDKPIIYKFYDEKGEVIGQYASGGSQAADVWTWADGTKHHDLTPFIERYKAQVEDLDEIKSGISSKGITLANVADFLKVQERIKGIIEAIKNLGVKVPQDLIDGFNSTVSTFDELMGNRPLIIETEIGAIEVSASELMRYVNEEFKRLENVKTSDLQRLPGIDPKDLEGLQDFKAYLESRSLNGSIGISVFKGLSPVGNLGLVERLVKKYVATYGAAIAHHDIDNDGLLEIDFTVFARSVNGTEPAYREAMRRIEEIRSAMGVSVPAQGFGNVEELIALLKKVEDLDAKLKESLKNLEAGLTMEEVFLTLLRNEVSRAISETYNNFTDQIRNMLVNQTNPIKVINANANVKIDSASVATFSSLTNSANQIDQLHLNMKAVVKAITEAFPNNPSLVNTVKNELNSQLYHINGNLENNLLNQILNGHTELQSTIQELGPKFPEGEMKINEVYAIIAQMDLLQETLSNKVKSFLEQLNVSASLKMQIMQRLDMRANHSYYGVYYAEHLRFQNTLKAKTIVFNVAGIGEVRLSGADLNAVAVPTEIASLLRFPGNPLTKEELNAMAKAHADQARSKVDFGNQVIKETPGFLSSLAMRFQFTEAFLNAKGNKVVIDGSIAKNNYSAYRRQLLMNKTLEIYFDAAIAAIETSMEEVEQIVSDSANGLSMENYQRLYALIAEGNKAATGILQLTLDNVIYDARQMVTNMLQDKFNELLARVDSVTKPQNGSVWVLVNINGKQVKVDALKIQTEIEKVMNRVALKMGSDFTREQLERLTGIDGLAELMSQYELYQNRQINFDHRKPTFSRSQNEGIANEEFWFALIPNLVKTFGTGIFNSAGDLDVNVFETKLTEGAKAPVESGENILDELRKARKEIIESTLAALNALDFSKLDQRLRGEELVIEAILAIEALGYDMIQGLNAQEISIIQNEMNHNSTTYLGVPGFIQITQLLNTKRATPVTEMTLPDGKILKIDMNHLINIIKGLQYSTNYDPELFPGVMPSDFEGAGQLNIPYYSQFILNKDVLRTRENFVTTSIDKIRFFAGLITRHYKNIESVPTLYRDDLFSEDSNGNVLLNFEKFRRFLKGIDTLHQQVEDQVTAWLEGDNGALAQLEKLKKKPMTVDSMLAMFDAIQGLQAKIMDYLNSLTIRHEQEDVMAMEVSLMKIFSRATRSMLDYYQENHLTMQVNGKSVVIPVQELTKRLQLALAERFPEEDDISAHHYAAFFGVSIEDIRGYQKLSEFLGGQIIALPRNSQYVYVAAKLSGIGLSQLMQDIISRYADQVVSVNGRLNIDKLMELISNGELAVERAKKRADEILAETMKQLENMEKPITNKSFDVMHALANDLRLKLVNIMNEHVSGFKKEMFDKVQAHVTALFDQFAKARIAKIMSGAVVINATDGSIFKIDFSQLEAEAAGRIMMLIADMEAKGLNQLNQKEAVGELIPIEFYFEHSPIIDWGFRTFSTSDMIMDYAMPVKSSYVAKQRVEYFPYYHPTHVAINDESQPTQFDFLKVLSRLATRYGSFVTDENGEFNSDLFLKALELTDSQRTTMHFAKLHAEAIKKLQAIVSEDSKKGITLEDIVKLHNQLADSKEGFLKALHALKSSADTSTYSSMVSLANSKWNLIMSEYENLAFTRDLLIEINGTQVRIPAAAIAKILRDTFNAGHRELLTPYIEGGEQQYQYNNLKALGISYSGGQRVVVDSVKEEFLKDDGVELSFRYPFTFGDLRKIKGINAQDLSDLEAVKREVRLTMREAEEMLRSRLNLRIFAPGSNVSTANIGSSAGMVMEASSSVARMSMSVQAEVMSYDVRVAELNRSERIIEGNLFEIVSIWNILPIKEPQKATLIKNLEFIIDQPAVSYPVIYNPIRDQILNPDYRPNYSLNLSERDLMFRVVPALIQDYADLLVKDGAVDMAALKELIENSEEALKKREAAKILETLESQAVAFKKAIASASPNLQTAGLTGLVVYANGRLSLKVYEPRFYRMLMKYTDAETNKISSAIAEEEGFAELLEMAGLNQDELLASKGSDIYQKIPSLNYELPNQIYAYTSNKESANSYIDGIADNEEKRFYPLPINSINWYQYQNKFVTIDSASFSFELQKGKVVGKVHNASGVTGIQFAKQAMDLLVSSKMSLQVKKLRDVYLEMFVYDAEEREKTRVAEGLKSQIVALSDALAKGDRKAQAQISASGFVRQDAQGYYVEVPEPWDIYYYLLENQSTSGTLKLSAITDEIVATTKLSRQELIKMPVETIIAYLPHFKFRLEDNLYSKTADLSATDQKMMSLPLDWRPETNWGKYLNQMVSLKGLAGYRLDKGKELEGFLKFAHSIEPIKFTSQASKILNESSEAQKAKTLRTRYEELLRSPEIVPRKILPIILDDTKPTGIGSLRGFPTATDFINYSRSLIDRVKTVTDRWRVDKKQEDKKDETIIKVEKVEGVNIAAGNSVVTEAAAITPVTSASLMSASPFFQSYHHLMDLTITGEE